MVGRSNSRTAISGALRMTAAILLPLLFGVSLLAQESPQYTKDGQLLMPKSYQRWTFLTTGVGMSYPEEGPLPAKPLFSNIFVNARALRGFQKTGVWPDKTVLLMERRASATKAALNKGGLFQIDLLGWLAHVKDSSRGGWTFYFIRKGTPAGKSFPKTAGCYACHEKKAATDTTFVHYYPTLIDAAKAKGTYREPVE